jgi:hypothetical protein
LWDLRQKLMARDKIPYDGVGFWRMLCCMPCYLAQQRRHAADREEVKEEHGHQRHYHNQQLDSVEVPPGSFAPPPSPPAPPSVAQKGAGKEPAPSLDVDDY